MIDWYGTISLSALSVAAGLLVFSKQKKTMLIDGFSYEILEDETVFMDGKRHKVIRSSNGTTITLRPIKGPIKGKAND